ncbi:MAG: molybdate ABC transporter substrate-binding protein [Chromatiales bacterium]|nr:molybdate ABC transporter substrate-binding protein [Chromatiales bacterium]
MPAVLRLFLIALVALSTGHVAANEAPTIAAAADLRFALERLAEDFRAKTGNAIRVSFGSSGNFTTQIENGAPFEIFLSADENYVFRLADQGLTRDHGSLYAVGRIVLFAPHGSLLATDPQLEQLRQVIAQGRLHRFAIANPEHAPYGRAARAALQTAGLWPLIQPSLVLGENAAQAAQFASSGSTDGGIIPLSLSKAPQLAALGTFSTIPADWHSAEPLRQRMVLLRNAGATAGAFYRFLQTEEARKTLAEFGFAVPNETMKE